MNSQPQPLAALQFPLRGSRLIEASAGTGKTFTIAALYLRLVLSHGQPPSTDTAEATAFSRALTPPEILVVTFTDAATKELRDRIRARLTEAAACFLATPDEAAAQPVGEDLLRQLRADYPPAAWPACARKLQLAAEWMDEAAVSTIHSWCNRMLREHAFDSDSLFTQVLETDQRELLAEVVRDYWRTFMYPLDSDEVSEVMAWWQGPEALHASLGKLIKQAGLLPACPPPQQAIRSAAKEQQQTLATLKAPWRAWADDLETLLDAAVAEKKVDGRSLQRRYYQPWFDSLRGWAADPQATTLDLKTGWERLTTQGMAAIWKDGPGPQHPALDAMPDLQAKLQQLPDAYEAILSHAAHWVAQRFASEQALRAQMGFDDLLTRLEAALLGANGERLAATIRRQFPVALIDEFQDTDAVQYRIFDTIYQVAQDDPASQAERALILIGDPKQAIYAFRGADIYTYLQARQACAGRLYTLKRNYRSTQAMVDATNRCFTLAEADADSAGAFLFRSAKENPVPFLPADAAGRQEGWQVQGQPPAALTLCYLTPEDENKPMSKGAYLAKMAEVCASEMVRLLNLGQQGQAGFAGDGKLRPLRPADLAVLVNNGNEAGLIRAALAARNVRSVYLSEKESVFDSAEALDLQLCLAACAEPDDNRKLRAALATLTLGLSWSTLDQLNRDELAGEARVMQFRAYRQHWQQQGVLPMLRHLLNDFQVPARLLADPQGQGERTLTNLLHLAELLQQASPLLDGEHALIRYLAEQRQGLASGGSGGGSGNARQLRLESDADLVQVVTVHKSKGLEYPLVFLPFACAFRASKAQDLPLQWHDSSGALQLALSNQDEVLVKVDHERLSEDLRKLYVALTRARYATFIGTAPINGLEHSALGYLLGAGQQPLLPALQRLSSGHPEIMIHPDPELSDDLYHTDQPSLQHKQACQPQRQVREQWWIASYSALQRADGREQRLAETADEAVFQESATPATPAANPELATAATIAQESGLLHDFPRGAAVGTFLHDLLEWAAGQGFARVTQSPALLRDMVARRCTLRGWQAWIEPLSTWLSDFLTMKLQLPALNHVAANGFSLAKLGNSVAEMEFWLATHHVDSGKIDALVCQHTLQAAPRVPLQPCQLKGMLKGFIDLVGEYQGRYFIIDYKSNWLGHDNTAYSEAAMQLAILEHRYELQYVLYTLALHRLLRLRLADYDYEQHVGGAIYFFLRGSYASSQGVHAERPPLALIEALDALFSVKDAQAAVESPLSCGRGAGGEGQGLKGGSHSMTVNAKEPL